MLQKTIANWVMLFKADEFWEKWMEEREPFYHENISADKVNELQKYIWGELQRISQEYPTVLLLEERTADVLGSLGEERGLSSRMLVCGPLMLNQLGKCETAQRLAQLGCKIEPSNNNLRKLMLYLSPLGGISARLDSRIV